MTFPSGLLTTVVTTTKQKLNLSGTVTGRWSATTPNFSNTKWLHKKVLFKEEEVQEPLETVSLVDFTHLYTLSEETQVEVWEKMGLNLRDLYANEHLRFLPESPYVEVLRIVETHVFKITRRDQQTDTETQYFLDGVWKFCERKVNEGFVVNISEKHAFDFRSCRVVVSRANHIDLDQLTP